MNMVNNPSRKHFPLTNSVLREGTNLKAYNEVNDTRRAHNELLEHSSYYLRVAFGLYICGSRHSHEA